MALTLTVRRFETVYFGDERVIVTWIEKDGGFKIKTPTGETFNIDEDMAREILPDVYMSAGDNQHEDAAKMVVDAPRSIVILREENYLGPTVNDRGPVHGGPDG